MPKVSFVKKQETIDCAEGANLMETLVNAGLPVASSCSGQGVCIKCVVNVIEGKENLSPKESLEDDLLDIHDLPGNVRMSCQTRILGDVKVDTDYW